jgi:superfamily II DNA or RNA helicase
MSGEWDYLLRIVARDVPDCEQFLVRLLPGHPLWTKPGGRDYRKIMMPPITEGLIEQATQSHGMLLAGRSYWAQGRVQALEVYGEGGFVTARVQGSGHNQYTVTIIFHEEIPGEVIPDVDCDCPVGFGCKHGAAVLFELQSRFGRQPGQPELALPLPVSLASPSVRIAPLPVPLSNWLSEAQTKARRQVGRADAFNIRYVFTARALNAGKTGKASTGFPQAGLIAQQLFVAAWMDEPAPNGQRRSSRLQTHDVQLATLTQDPIDPWLVRRMSHYGGDLDSAGSPHGVGGADWLNTVIATGRARWGKPDGPLLHRAPRVGARFDWVIQGDGTQRLALDLGHVDEPDDLVLLAQAPPLLINCRTGAVHLLDTDVDETRARQLLTMPPVPPHAVAAVSASWDEIVGDAVAPPSLSQLVDRGIIAPTPVLTFREDSLDIFVPSRGRFYSRGTFKQATALGRLTFDYDGYAVTPATDESLIYISGADGVACFRRDLAAEARALARLLETSMQPLDTFGEIKTKPAQGWDLIVHPGARPADYVAVLQQDVPRLRAEGWRIDFAAKWSLSVVEIDVDSLAFDVSPSGIDWFDVSLGVRVDGKAFDILPLLRKLLAGDGATLLDQPGAMLSLPLGPGKIAQVPFEQLKPVLASLLQLALHDGPVDGRLRLPSRDLATLADLESATQSHVPWRGGDALRQLARALTRLQIEPTTLPGTFKANLRPYQQQGLDWLQALHKSGFGGVLADDMGLGKTVQALAHLATLKANGELHGPALIVCPTSVLPNWQAEMKQFAPDLRCLFWHGTDRHGLFADIAGSDIVLTSYPLLARDHDELVLQTYGLVVLDEAHVLKNSRTAGFKAARRIKSRQVVALTGTPVENQLGDIWSLVELVTPGLLGPLDGFTRAYTRPIARDNDPVAKARLARRLRPFLLRRTKDEVAGDLPAKTEIPEWIDLEAGQLALYESVRLLMHNRVREEIARVGLMRSQIILLDAMLKLRQICCDPRLLPSQPGRNAGSAKLARLFEMLPEMLGEGRRVILFSQFTSMLDLIKPALTGRAIGFAEIRGSTKDRKTPVADFQSGAVPVILVSLKAGGTGLNLTAADTVILYDPWWNPAVEAQAIDRAHRIGQTNPVFVHRLVARGSIEEKILTLQEKKRALAATLWSDDSTALSGLTEDDVQFLLG